MLELLSGRKAMEVKENGEVVLSCKEIRGILEVEEKREETLKKMDGSKFGEPLSH